MRNVIVGILAAATLVNLLPPSKCPPVNSDLVAMASQQTTNTTRLALEARDDALEVKKQYELRLRQLESRLAQCQK